MNAIEKVGDESLLSRHKIAFLCSRLVGRQAFARGKVCIVRESFLYGTRGV